MNTRAPILMYHAVDDQPTAACRRLAVRPAALARQLEHLLELGLTPVTVSQLATAVGVWRADSTGLGAAGGKAPPTGLPPRPIALTFDDGYADFHEVVLPLLARYDFTATVFVTSGWIADAGVWAAPGAPARMLSRGQIREVAAAGVEIGGHSHSHPALDQLSPLAARDEVRRSKDLIEDLLGRAVGSFAYPFGYSNPGVRRAVGAAGYGTACTVSNAVAGAGDNPLALPRLTVRWTTSLASFDRIARGDGISSLFLADRALSAGWAAVRRTAAILRRVGACG